MQKRVILDEKENQCLGKKNKVKKRVCSLMYQGRLLVLCTAFNTYHNAKLLWLAEFFVFTLQLSQRIQFLLFRKILDKILYTETAIIRHERCTESHIVLIYQNRRENKWLICIKYMSKKPIILYERMGLQNLLCLQLIR